MSGKSEVRNPKSEGNPRAAVQGRGLRCARTTLVIARPRYRISEFGFLSDFGFRISAFVILPHALPTDLFIPS